MDASYFKELQNFAKTHQSSTAPISEYVKRASSILSYPDFTSLEGFFTYFTAINYLNFAVKKDKSITYFFKKYVEPACYAAVYSRPKGLTIYYNAKERLVLASFYGFIYSFHEITFTNMDLAVCLSQSKPITFDGVRKQACANELFAKVIFKKNAPKTSKSIERNESYAEPLKERKLNGGIRYTFDCDHYPLQEIANDFHLNQLSGSKTLTKNVAIVISTLYFYNDIINSSQPRLPDWLIRSIYREIITQSFSIVEALEIEYGARSVGKEMYAGRSSKVSRKENQKYKGEFDKLIGMDPSTAKMYKHFKELRNNVHLSKEQSIENQSELNAQTVSEFIDFMCQYIQFLASRRKR